MKSPEVFWERVCNAETRADFPQLFGPSRTVKPAAGSMTVWTCDMKLSNSIRLIMLKNGYTYRTES